MYSWRDLFICELTRSVVWHDSCALSIHTCDGAHSKVRHGSTDAHWVSVNTHKYSWDMTHSYISHDSCAITHANVWHFLFVCMPRLFGNSQQPFTNAPKYMCVHDSFVCVPGLIHTRDMLHSYVWLILTCDTAHSCVWYDSLTMPINNWRARTNVFTNHSVTSHQQVRDFICMCAVTHSYLQPGSLTCVTWLRVSGDVNQQLMHTHEWIDNQISTQHKQARISFRLVNIFKAFHH